MLYLTIFGILVVLMTISVIYDNKKNYACAKLDASDITLMILVPAVVGLMLWFFTFIISTSILETRIDSGKIANYCVEIESENYLMVEGLDHKYLYIDKDTGSYRFAYYEDNIPISIKEKYPAKVLVVDDVKGESPRITIHKWKAKNSFWHPKMLQEIYETYDIFLPSDSLINFNY